MLTSLRRLLILLVLAMSTAGAQSDSLSHVKAPTACVAAIPRSAMRPVAVYLTASLDNGSNPAMEPAADNLLQPLADRIDALLGAGRDTIPRGEPRINWLDVDAARGVHVVWHRDGHTTWALQPRKDPTPADTSDGPATALLLRAVEAADKASELTLVWMEGVKADSIGGVVGFYRTQLDTLENPQPAQLNALVPVFTVAAPRSREVTVRNIVPPAYPSGALYGGANGKLTLQFVVDTTGRAVMSTLHDSWPVGRPRLAGTLGSYYRTFLAEATRSVAAATFEPATIEGCPVRQVVQQPFTFTIR